MALEAPLRSSTGNLQFPFSSNKGDMSASSDADGIKSPFRTMSSPPPATDSGSLRPASARITSNPIGLMSPTDLVGPSPVTSNGTETTEIEDDASEEVHAQMMTEREGHQRTELAALTTTLPDIIRQPEGEEVSSVIHAPKGFDTWASSSSETLRQAEKSQERSYASPEPFASRPPSVPPAQETLPIRPSVSTDVKPVRYSVESATPRAQDMQNMLDEASRLRSSSTSSLEKIDEQTETEADDDEDYVSEVFPLNREEEEVKALKTALQECWTLCNTLASLSSIHRARVFNSSGTPDAHEKAWKTCWKLCQRLYDNQDESDDFLSVRENLDLCRDFCQALFDVRLRKDEVADSVLRVSFELNNHLYSAQDSRNLPEMFRERTLDFYITLCHRLMKQRGDVREETDHLLQACWSLAEMLFSLRQNLRDGKSGDEELLGSAVQACWDLCDIFRNGWTQIRPDRITPRPTQTSFFPHQSTGSETGRQSRNSDRSSLSKRESVKARDSREQREQREQEQRARKPPAVPETPVTEFEDTPISPEGRSPNMPNIMVLGTGTSDSGRGRWSSSASNLSSYSQSSARTSSTATTTALNEDPNINRSKILVLKAAMNLGFNRDAVTDPKGGPVALQKFVQNMHSTSFGPSASYAVLVQQYKNSVLTDAIIPRNHALPARGKRVSAEEMANSVKIMIQSSPRYAYLGELYKVVFQFPLEEAESHRNIIITV
ncbi:hypothetical protein NLU13_8161 [Sarocladium strictum]|uniref:DUF7624 domain-containing protein n=1 Tax=Sarocladium strictum TaxID=5046 RepID=A0AA39GDG1_SARSR|nr:hypothetical protein NLU13_8161 [Sarocladium strictum]